MRTRPCSQNIFLYCLLTLFLLTSTYSGDVCADETLKYQKILERWSQGLPELQKSDTGETAKEIALIRSWIGQAQAYVANEKFEKIDPLLERIETMVKFVRARQDRVKIESALKGAKRSLAELKQTIAKTRADADAMLAQIKEHEKNN